MDHNIRVTPEVALENEDEVRQLIARCAVETLLQENVDFEAFIDVMIVDDDSIRALNSTYRSKDSVTDVLSFPMYEFYNGEPEEALSEDPESKKVMLGDMVLNYERACQQAAEFGHSAARECGFLTVHSVLHLLGYDHERGDADRKIMREHEETVLRTLGLTREAP